MGNKLVPVMRAGLSLLLPVPEGREGTTAGYDKLDELVKAAKALGFDEVQILGQSFTRARRPDGSDQGQGKSDNDVNTGAGSGEKSPGSSGARKPSAAG